MFPRHGEVVGVRFEQAKAAAIDNNLTVGRGIGIITRHTEGFSKAKERAAFNGRAAAIGVVTRHDKRAGAALDQRTVIFPVGIFLRDGSVVDIRDLVAFTELILSRQIRAILGRFHPSLVFSFTSVKRDLTDVVRPNVQSGVAHVVVKLAKELARTVHALVKVRNTPTVDFVRRTISCRPTFKLRTVGVVVVGRREHHVANLNGVHVHIA